MFLMPAILNCPSLVRLIAQNMPHQRAVQDEIGEVKKKARLVKITITSMKDDADRL